MEKLAILAAVLSIPSILFIIMAKVTGTGFQKWVLYFFMKIPAIISLIIICIMALVHFNFIKLA